MGKKNRTEALSFPAADQAWLKLQEHVISITGKTIEDLDWLDRSFVIGTLTDNQREAFRAYLRENKLKQMADPAPDYDEDWEERVCEKSWGWLINEFLESTRIILGTLSTIEQKNQIAKYSLLLEDIKRELFEISDRYPEMGWKGKGSNTLDEVFINIALVPPTDEGLELLNRTKDRLVAREKELEELKTKQMAARKEDNSAYEEYARRRDFERIFELAKSIGVIECRGRRRYFCGNKLAGNGEFNMIWKIIHENYGLEAEIRVAVAQAAATHVSPAAPMM